MHILKLRPLYYKSRARFHFLNRKVCLTFDDGHKYTEQILEKLKKYEQKATFFLCGEYIKENPALYKKAFEAGHEIGNHSYTHSRMTALSEEEIQAEIAQTQQLIQEIIGQEQSDTKLFRFPYGASNTALTQLVKEQRYLPVSWTIDSRDWTGIQAPEIYHNIICSRHLKNGAVILMHTSGAHTAEALDLLLPTLKKWNYKLLTVSALHSSLPTIV